MNCKNCGNPLRPGEVYCTNCGKPVENMQPMNNGSMMNNNQGYNMDNNIYNQGPTMYNNQEQNMYNNQMNNNGQMMNNYSNNQMNNQPPMMNNQQNNNAKILAIVGGAIVLAIIVLVVVLLTTSKSKSAEEYKSNNTVAQANTYKTNYSGYRFDIPNDYLVQIEQGYLVIYNQEDTWAMALEIVSANFTQVKTNRNDLKEKLENNNHTVSSVDIKTIDGVEYLIYNVSIDGMNKIYAFAKLDSYVVTVTAYNVSNQFDSSLLNKLSPILKSAKKSGTTMSIQMDEIESLKDYLD